MVSSFVTTAFLQVPNTDGSDFSRVNPMSSETTVAPVKAAISLSIAFLLSPNAGALTAQTFNPPLNLLRTKVASASLLHLQLSIKEVYFLTWHVLGNVRYFKYL